MKRVIVSLLLIIGFLFLVNRFVVAQEKTDVNFFYSVTCPHCIKEHAFWDRIEKKYKSIKVNRYEASKNGSLLIKFYQNYHVSLLNQSQVPITFIRDKYFVGFSDQIGQQMEDYILNKPEKPVVKTNNYPIIAGIIFLSLLVGYFLFKKIR